MDSRDIYNLTRRNIKFEEDWIYVGIGKDINREKLSKQLTNHFRNYQTLMVKRDRTNSEEIEFQILTEVSH